MGGRGRKGLRNLAGPPSGVERRGEGLGRGGRGGGGRSAAAGGRAASAALQVSLADIAAEPRTREAAAARRRDEPAPRARAPARGPRVRRRRARQRCRPECGARRGAEGGRSAGAPPRREPGGARGAEPRRPRVSGGRSRGRSGARPETARERGPRRPWRGRAGPRGRRGGEAGAAGGGGSGGGSGCGRAGGGGQEPFPGGIPPPLPAPNLPGNSRGPGRGVPGPLGHRQVVELAPGSPAGPRRYWGGGAAVRPASRAQARVSGPGSRPARLPPRPRLRGASRRATLGPTPRGVLGGGARCSPPPAPGPPGSELFGFPAGKSEYEKGQRSQTPRPGPAALVLPLPRARPPGPEASPHHRTPEPENGLPGRVSPWRSGEASLLSAFVSVLPTPSECCCFVKAFPWNCAARPPGLSKVVSKF